ncbi:hypothetical protein OG413_10760 [Streptomyces sp. NBC_01433]|uniref:hypothetical protein n=1 Tax=Streptomyces sp. NBC_01433 TaxID=2903864 RepID=UPI0022538301|nr:hypothetical protein [Streptomyces sp. NBC_01433]MCX4675781.1 hypothetical protein [Streptomyces sp. NBC_01433]
MPAAATTAPSASPAARAAPTGSMAGGTRLFGSSPPSAALSGTTGLGAAAVRALLAVRIGR